MTDHEVAERIEMDEMKNVIAIELSGERTVWPHLCQTIASRQNLRKITMQRYGVSGEPESETVPSFLHAIHQNCNIQEVKLVWLNIPSLALLLAMADE